ncbi:hypothetical protein [Luteibacter sp.]
MGSAPSFLSVLLGLGAAAGLVFFLALWALVTLALIHHCCGFGRVKR